MPISIHLLVDYHDVCIIDESLEFDQHCGSH